MDNKETREEMIRDLPAATSLASEVIEDLTGQKLSMFGAADVCSQMYVAQKKVKYPYERLAAKKARKKAMARAKRAQSRRISNEQRLSQLKVRLQAGDPDHPDYERRLKAAKKTVALAVSLPVIARRKWANPEFQKQMQEKGHNYNPAEYKGWLPYKVAKQVQSEVIKARSRGEYEFFIKLYDIRFLPARPDAVYIAEWEGWTEFLGTTNVFGVGVKESVKGANYRTFHESLSFARTLKLKSSAQWIKACKDGLVPLDVPMDPHNVYEGDFIDINHWLGVSTALDKVTGKVIVPDVWVLYQDGREDAFWWAKMSAEKYTEFAKTPIVTVGRVYEFEGSLSKQVWEILDSLSEPYEDDVRERFVDNTLAFNKAKSELDAILKWSNI